MSVLTCLLRSSASIARAFPSYRLRATAKYWLLSSIHPVVAWQLHSAMQDNTVLSQFVQSKPQLLMKPLRHYFNRTYLPQTLGERNVESGFFPVPLGSLIRRSDG